MAAEGKARVAIVDYGMGNLFSVKNACEKAGMQAVVASSRKDVLSADAVILPGVGAFGSAMERLRELRLVDALHGFVASGKPLVGICLGMQLLMDESLEFGRNKGLGIVKGKVVRFEHPKDSSGEFKVPQVGWNRILRPKGAGWGKSLLEGTKDGAYMYFVHSFYVAPEDKGIVLSSTRYGNIEFCSSLRKGNVFGFQHHPERSGVEGLRVYSNLASMIEKGGFG